MEEAAKQIISITSVLQGIYFATISFSEFGKYLGIEEIESLRERADDLYKLYWDIGANRTLAIFYAFRNYLGKLDT